MMQLQPEIFDVQFLCRISEDQLSVRWNPNTAPLPRQLSRSINRFWEELRQHRKPDVVLFNGTLCRLDRYRFQKNHLRLWLSKTNYKHSLYCNEHAQQILSRWGEGNLSNALGVSAVVKTADGQILIMKRSMRVGELPGYLDVFGGHIDPRKDIIDDAPHPFSGIKAELRDELGVHQSDISVLTCIGMVNNRSNLKPELVFAAHINLPLETVKEAAFGATEADEFTDIVSFADHRSDLCSFLCQWQKEITPSAYGSLWLYGIFKGHW